MELVFSRLNTHSKSDADPLVDVHDLTQLLVQLLLDPLLELLDLLLRRLLQLLKLVLVQAGLFLVVLRIDLEFGDLLLDEELLLPQLVLLQFGLP